MSNLTKTVLKRPVAALVIVVSLMIFGISSVLGLKLQLIPDISMPLMAVVTTYPQAGPEDVEQLVTEKIEDGCGTISGLDNIESYSEENMSFVIFSFEYGTNMDNAFIDMQEAVERVKSELPDDADAPTIITVNMDAQEVMNLSVDSKENVDLLSYVNDTVEPELQKVSDVAQVNVSGGNKEYISVEVVPELIRQYKLDLSAIADAVKAANFTMPAGSADYGKQNLNINAKVEYKTPEEIATIPITTSSGNVIHLSDIANVHYGYATPDSYSRYNDADNVSVGLTKKQASSAVTLSGKVMKVIDRLNRENPDVTITAVYDSSESIVASIKSIAETLLIGVLLTMAVLFLFFGDIKGSLIVGSSMPVSLLMTFILMSFLGFSLNLVTMGALVIGIGMMVDNAIVVIEMCFRKKDEGMTYIDAAYEATKIVINSIIASTITTIVVYLPLAMMEGLSGQMFGQLGYTIIFALVTSLFSAITLVPLCFSQYKPIERKESKVNHILAKIEDKYGNLLQKALHRKKLVALISIVIFGISIFLFKFVNLELMGETDEGQVQISAEFRPGMQLDIMDKKARELEEFVKNSPYIDDYSATVKEADAVAKVNAYVADGCKKTALEIVDEWTEELDSYKDNCEISVASVSSMDMGGGGSNGYQITLESNNLEDVKAGCLQTCDAAMKADGVISVSSSLADAGSKAQIKIDPIKASAAGMTPKQIAGSLHTIMSGSDAMDVTIDRQKYTVTVEYSEDEYTSINDVGGIILTNTKGNDVPLSEVADINYTDSPMSIHRKDGNYQGIVTATLTADAKYTGPKEIGKQMEKIILPSGVNQVQNTEDERMQEEFTALIKAIITAIILVYIVMAIEFENLRYSAMVMFCIPFSLIGSIALLLITQCTVSMTSLMGFLMLIGIVVNNGILYVDYTNQLRKTMSTEEALIATGKSRLRPILMTTLTTVLSMIPMALGFGKNGKMMQGMAVVIVGGLTASTILTLILLPTFYMIIHKRSKNKKAKKKAKQQKETETITEK